jgi:branched-chain amino acid transport system substrate-binding protein
MRLSRRALLGTAAATASAAMPFRRARAQRPLIRIGVLNDMSGPYSDDGGPMGLLCARQAVLEWGDHGFDVEIISGDHQNKPDVGAGLAREWIDQGGVDVVVDVPTSSVALAVNTVCREKNKVFLNSGGGTSDLTGAQCSPNTVHWTYDTYMLSKSTGGATVKAGGDSWFFITADYVFGQQLERDTSRIVTAAGGKVLGARRYPFPTTTDFSSFLVEAQASGAKVLGLANAGGDTINCVKQAVEFGLTKTMTVAMLLGDINSVHAIGLDVAQGLTYTESFYWDLNERTRAFTARVKPKIQKPNQWTNMVTTGNYGAILHYLKAVNDMGVAEAKKSGVAAVTRMKAMPTDDDCFGPGRIREDGRKLHPSYLMQAKKPSESTSPWDLARVIATTPAEEAFRPLSEGGCSFIKA